jgi:hypothetical protein
MNREANGTVAEVAGVIGVIASLVYLSIQIRHSSKSARASMQHDILSEFRCLVGQQYLDKGLD